MLYASLQDWRPPKPPSLPTSRPLRDCSRSLRASKPPSRPPSLQASKPVHKVITHFWTCELALKSATSMQSQLPFNTDMSVPHSQMSIMKPPMVRAPNGPCAGSPCAGRHPVRVMDANGPCACGGPSLIHRAWQSRLTGISSQRIPRRGGGCGGSSTTCASAGPCAYTGACFPVFDVAQ